MGQHKHNPVAIAAKNGELPPKKKGLSKRETEILLKRMILEKTALNKLYSILDMAQYGEGHGDGK